MTCIDSSFKGPMSLNNFFTQTDHLFYDLSSFSTGFLESVENVIKEGVTVGISCRVNIYFVYNQQAQF